MTVAQLEAFQKKQAAAGKLTVTDLLLAEIALQLARMNEEVRPAETETPPCAMEAQSARPEPGG